MSDYADMLLFFFLGEYCLQVVLWYYFRPYNEAIGGAAQSELDDRLVSMIQDFCKL